MVFTACIDDEFSTSTTDLLTFSTDTVKFDTVITRQGSPTKQFLVYNRGEKMLNISSIRVAGESNGHFFLNVDGVKGDEFHDIEVRGHDSIYVLSPRSHCYFLSHTVGYKLYVVLEKLWLIGIGRVE